MPLELSRARILAQPFDGGQRQPRRLGGADDGAGERMAAVALERAATWISAVVALSGTPA